jgi:hypothetical protein
MQNDATDSGALFTSLDSFRAAFTDWHNMVGFRSLASTIGSICRDKST